MDESAAPLTGFTTSSDTKAWSSTGRVVNASSPTGLQMTIYRGELYGILTGNNNRLYATKYKAGDACTKGWKEFRILPEKYRAVGRVGVTVLSDRFYVAYRGTNQKVYLLYTENFSTWVDLGEFSPGGLLIAAPAIAAYDGKIYAVAPGLDKVIYCAIRQNRTNEVVQKWTNLGADTKTEQPPALVAHHAVLYMFYASLDKKAIGVRTILTGRGWSAVRSISASITVGPSAVSYKYDRIAISFQGLDNEIARFTCDSQLNNLDKMVIKGKKMVGGTGIATYIGKVFISYAVKPGSEDFYTPPVMTGEKMEYSHVEEAEVEDWDCKWNEEGSSKSFFKKMLCM